MEKEALKRIFDFLEGKEKINKPFKWKLVNGEPLTEEELNVENNLILKNSKISSLPEGLKIGGILNLYGCKNMASLPKKIEIGGSLNLTGTNIMSLPEGFKVGHSLHIVNTKIKSLPKGLYVGGNLYLTYTEITKLPKGLKVGGNLYIRKTELEGYTDKEIREMIKPGVIKGAIFR